MKNRLLYLSVMLLLVIGIFAVSVMAEEPALPTTCEHCKKEVTWTALTEADLDSTTTLASGHYYLAFDGNDCESAEIPLAAARLFACI